MLDKGEGVQKSENFVDVINGCPLSPVVGCLFVLLGRACAARRGSRPSAGPVRPSGQSHICHKTLNIQQIEEPSNFIEKGEINLILGSPPSQDPGEIWGQSFSLRVGNESIVDMLMAMIIFFSMKSLLVSQMFRRSPGSWPHISLISEGIFLVPKLCRFKSITPFYRIGPTGLARQALINGRLKRNLMFQKYSAALTSKKLPSGRWKVNEIAKLNRKGSAVRGVFDGGKEERAEPGFFSEGIIKWAGNYCSPSLLLLLVRP